MFVLPFYNKRMYVSSATTLPWEITEHKKSPISP